MNKHLYIGALLAIGSLRVVAAPADTTTFDRHVTVERDYKPTLQEAQKISVQPEVVIETQEAVQVEYSTYNVPVAPTHNLSPIEAGTQSFRTVGEYDGYVSGGVGHSQTRLDFGYRLNDGKSSILNCYAHHKAEWGIKERTWSDSRLGMDFKHTFRTSDVYFGVEGGNLYYTRRYGYEGFDPSVDNTSLWRMKVQAGVRSNKSKSPVTYDLHAGYGLLGAKTILGPTIEHQIHVGLDMDYAMDKHHVGVRIGEHNYFIQTHLVPDSIYDPRIAVRLEPYYAYRGNRVQVHAGIHLDLNHGRGRLFTNVDQLCFAPSPHVEFEAQIAPKWLTVFATAEGSLANGTLSSFMAAMPYRILPAGIVSHHLAAYTPIDANVGLRIKAAPTLLIELHGGYVYQKNQTSLIGNDTTGMKYWLSNGEQKDMRPGDFAYVYSDYGCGKVGALAEYHYRDIFSFRLWGDYYMWQSLGHEASAYKYADGSSVAMDSATVYDRAKWQMGLRLDGRIDKHWSLYSDNRLMGSRTVMTTSGEQTLKPVVNINLGCQWEACVGRHVAHRSGREMPNLACFLEIENLIHRHNQLYYGYESAGIQVLVGASYKF